MRRITPRALLDRLLKPDVEPDSVVYELASASSSRPVVSATT